MSVVRLPVLHPISERQLIFFDLKKGHKNALRVLRSQLGFFRTLRVISELIWRGIFSDPTTKLPKAKTNADKLTYYQLRPVVLLYYSLKDGVGLSEDETVRVLRQVVLSNGALFMGAFVPEVNPEQVKRSSQQDREQFLRELEPRLFNAELKDSFIDESSLRFNVGKCRFVEATRILGLQGLAPMFCEVDACFFADDSTIEMNRTGTIAQGASQCDFEFRFVSASSNSSESR